MSARAATTIAVRVFLYLFLGKIKSQTIKNPGLIRHIARF